MLGMCRYEVTLKGKETVLLLRTNNFCFRRQENVAICVAAPQVGKR